MGLPFFIQPLILNWERSSQIPVLGVTNVGIRALCSRLGIQKVSRNSKSMPNFGSKMCPKIFPKFVNFFLYCHHSPERFQVRLFIIVLIDPPIPNPSNILKITIQLWRAIGIGQQRHACMVCQEDDWSHAASSLYILLSDIFGDQVPMSLVKTIACLSRPRVGDRPFFGFFLIFIRYNGLCLYFIFTFCFCLLNARSSSLDLEPDLIFAIFDFLRAPLSMVVVRSSNL